LHAPATCALALACGVVYAAQRVMTGVPFMMGHPFAEPFTYIFGIHPPLLAGGFFWQPLTYAFLHGPWWHLFCNLFGLVLFGGALEAELRTPRFLRLFFASSVLGGLCWALGQWVIVRFAGAEDYGTCIGASGGVYGLIGAYTALYANRKLYVLLYFIPLRLRGKTLAMVIVLLTILDALLGITQTAYAAHLAGFVVGWLYGCRLRRQGYGEGYAV
jgi:membrane associated rhomboid family serine protease